MMRLFVVLCLVAVACGDKLGYNYHPVEHSQSGLSFAPGVSGSAPVHHSASVAPSAPAEYQKEFYSFTAPDGEFEDPNAGQSIGGQKKNLRVIFIKTPESRALENAALSLAKQAADHQTAIYVLHKQPDVSGLADKLNAIHNSNHQRPEVHFVKYRTPEDAANAQRTIQSQYDSLGGTSQSHNGGVAPVLNFASQAPVHHAQVAQAQAPSSSYLPASVLRRLRLRLRV